MGAIAISAKSRCMDAIWQRAGHPQDIASWNTLLRPSSWADSRRSKGKRPASLHQSTEPDGSPSRGLGCPAGAIWDGTRWSGWRADVLYRRLENPGPSPLKPRFSSRARKPTASGKSAIWLRAFAPSGWSLMSLQPSIITGFGLTNICRHSKQRRGRIRMAYRERMCMSTTCRSASLILSPVHSLVSFSGMGAAGTGSSHLFFVRTNVGTAPAEKEFSWPIGLKRYMGNLLKLRWSKRCRAMQTLMPRLKRLFLISQKAHSPSEKSSRHAVPIANERFGISAKTGRARPLLISCRLASISRSREARSA